MKPADVPRKKKYFKAASDDWALRLLKADEDIKATRLKTIPAK